MKIKEKIRNSLIDVFFLTLFIAVFIIGGSIIYGLILNIQITTYLDVIVFVPLIIIAILIYFGLFIVFSFDIIRIINNNKH